jgi:hypothetical protein
VCADECRDVTRDVVPIKFPMFDFPKSDGMREKKKMEHGHVMDKQEAQGPG